MDTLQTPLKPSPDKAALPDRDIVAAVERLLARKKGVVAHLIDVVAHEGIVTLTGYTDNLLARERAEEIARAVRGVRGVINELVVRAIDLPDATLRHDAEEALLQDAVTSEFEISCTAREGVVMLLGEVPSWPEKELVLRVVKGVRGVCAIEDHLRCRAGDAGPGKAADRITAEVEELLGWDVHINHALIKVETHEGGTVVLSGVVGSAAERSHAMAAAWRAGATGVEAGELVVEPDVQSQELRGDKYRPRSDGEIHQAILDTFFYDPRVRSGEPEVEVERGQVTLRGTVGNLRACWAAEQDALGVVGVWLVNNYLRVRPAQPVADADMLRQAQAALRRDPYLHRFPVEIVATNGKISLYGTVDSQFEKRQAEQVVAGIHGVIAVDNRLVVPAWATTADGDYFACSVAYSPPQPGTPLTDVELEHRIKRQLYWTPGLSSQDIHVGVTKGRASLIGTVDTPHEQQLATLCAYEGGASTVNNQLHVRYGAAQ